MEVRTVSVLHSNKCPFSGTGIVVVVEQTESSVHLFYPFTLEEWTMSPHTKYDDRGDITVEGYDLARKDTFTDVSKIVKIVRNRVRLENELGRSVPNPETVSRVISSLEGTPLAEVQRELGASIASSKPDAERRDVKKLTTRLRLKKHEELVGRDAEIARAMITLGPATVGQILEEALKTWPTRAGKQVDRANAERHVVYCTNRWINLGWVEIV